VGDSLGTVKRRSRIMERERAWVRGQGKRETWRGRRRKKEWERGREREKERGRETDREV